MRAVIAGEDPDGLGEALEGEGVGVAYAEGTANAEALRDAGIGDADLFVLTEARLATSIPVATELNGDVRVVCYTRDSLPEFVAGQAGHVVDPKLISADIVAEELTGNGE